MDFFYLYQNNSLFDSPNLKKQLNIEERDPIEISMDGSSIILQKYENRCVFCGAIKPSIRYNGKLVCSKCLKALNKTAEDNK